MAQHSFQQIHERVVSAYNKSAPSGPDSKKLGPLDSLGFMAFIVELENEFQISIPNEDITADHFATADSISHYLSTQLSSQPNA